MISARGVHTSTNPKMENIIMTERSCLRKATMTRVRNTSTRVNKDRNRRLLYPMSYARRSSSSHDWVSSFQVYDLSSDRAMEWGVARYTYRRGSTKGTVEASKSYPCLGGRCTLSRHSFYLLCFYTFSPTFHLVHIHTKVDSSRE